VTVADASHPGCAVAPRPRRRTPFPASHPDRDAAHRVALSHPVRGAAHLVVLPHLLGGV